MSVRPRRTMTALLPASVGIAALVVLSGCTPGPAPTDNQTSGAQSAEAADPPTAEAAAPGGMSGESAPSDAPDSSAAQPSPEDPYKDSARTKSWASDANMKIDKKGNGTVPKASIEADLIDLFKNKFKMTVKTADCARDMMVAEWHGFITCDVKDDTMTYYGTVDLVDHKDGMIQYEVLFPGIKNKDLDLNK